MVCRCRGKLSFHVTGLFVLDFSEKVRLLEEQHKQFESFGLM